MSSTNRGETKMLLEGYATRDWTVRRLLDRIGHKLPTGNKAKWLEPNAGHGDIIKPVLAYYPGIKWSAIEYVPSYRPFLEKLVPASRIRTSNFLEQCIETRFDVIMTNPAFSIAQEVAEKSLEHADHVIMYQRLNWFATLKRHEFLTTFCPDVYVLPNRPSHTPDKKNDSIEYAWFHWSAPDQRRVHYGSIELLDLTPKEERKRK